MTGRKQSGPARAANTAGPSPTPGGDQEQVAGEVTRAVGYARVSTREQAEDGASLDAQRLAVEREIERRAWDLVEVLEDAGSSGKDLKRAGVQRALDLLATGKADVLVSAKLDRLSRSVLDFAGLLERSRREGWKVVVLDVGVDTSTDTGELLVNVMASFAQYERRIIGARTRDAMAVRKAQGVVMGRPRSVPADTVEQIRTLRAEGLSLQGVADQLNEDGVVTGHGAAVWRKQSVAAVLARQDGG